MHSSFRQRWPWMLSILLWICSVVSICAGDLSNVLKGVHVSSTDQFERVTLEFEQIFNEEPVINFDPGYLSIYLSRSTKPQGIPATIFPPANPLIKSIRITQGDTAVLIEIILKQNHISPENKYIFTHKSTRILLDLDRKALENAIPTRPSIGEELAEEMNQKANNSGEFLTTFPKQDSSENTEDALFSEDALPPPSSVPAQDWVMTMMTMVLSLCFVLLLIYLLAFIYNRFFAGRIAPLQGKFSVNIVSTFHVGTKQKIIVIEINKHYFACGVTPSAIHLLTELKDKNDQSFLDQVKVSEEKIELNSGKIRSDFLTALETARKTASQIEKSVAPLKEPEKKTVKPAPPAQPDSSLPQENSNKKRMPSRKKKETTSFHTPVAPPIVPEPENTDYKGNSEMNQFSKKLTQKLKSLKPIR